MKSLLAAPRRALLLLIVMAVLLLIAPGAYAKIRTPGGGDVPYYALINPLDLYHTDEWAVIVFYRPPDCVPDEFNLLEFFTVAAFECTPPTTDGFLIWAGEPGLSTPIQSQLHGLGAVPVWFVAWPELEAAIADGSLTMPELEALPSLLIGSASFYNETTHPLGGAVVPMVNFVADGTLADGRSFHTHVTWPHVVSPGETVPSVSIEFE